MAEAAGTGGEGGSGEGGGAQPESLHELFQHLVDDTDGEKTTFGDLLESVGVQAYGPLLLVPSLIAALPVIGAIPGISVITGSLVGVIALQMLIGRRQPWLPKKLTGFTFKREPLVKGVEWAEPKLEKLDRFIRPRLSFLVRGPSRRLVALAAILNAALFYPAALLPFAVTAPALTVAVLAVGVTTTDGNWVIAGYLFTALSVGLIAYLSFSGLIPL